MNHKLSKLALGLAAMLTFAGAASAAPTMTVLNGGDTIQFADGKMAAGSFSDVFSFTEAKGGTMTGFSLNDLGQKNISYTLLDVTDNKMISTGTNVIGTKAFSFNEVYNAGDVFKLTVSGIANKNAMFIGTVSAVPEPGEWALMASGLGLLGFIATRRRSNANTMQAL